MSQTPQGVLPENLRNFHIQDKVVFRSLPVQVFGRMRFETDTCALIFSHS